MAPRISARPHSGTRAPLRRSIIALLSALLFTASCHDLIVAPERSPDANGRASAVLTASPTTTASDGSYDIRALEIGSATSAQPNAINLAGDVVGSTQTGTQQLAVFWPGDGGPLRVLPPVPNYARVSNASGVNDAGDAVGWASGDGYVRAVVWPAKGNPIVLPLPPTAFYSIAVAINASGDVAGFEGGFGPYRAMFWPAGGTPRILIPPSGIANALSQASAINSRGDVAGYVVAGGNTRAVVWPLGGTPRDLHALVAGAVSSNATGINSTGDVVGDFVTSDNGTHAVIWPASGGMRELGPLAASPTGRASTTARSINDAGDVVGRSVGHPVIWPHGGAVRALGTLGGLQGIALSVSGLAEVVGMSVDLTNVWRPTRWSPAIARVVVDPATARLRPTAPGNQQQLTASLLDAVGNPVRRERHVVTWSSDAPAIAAVDANGLVTALAPGSATVSATSDGRSGSASITVVAPTDGYVFVFSVGPADHPGDNDVYMQRSDGTGRVNLTNTPGIAEWRARPSPDGKQIAFERENDVYILDLAPGASPVNLTHGVGSFNGDPHFSPDGTRIYFSSSRTGSYHVWSMDLGGGSLKQLSFAPVDEGNAMASRDGTQIAYVRAGANGYDVWVMNANGSNPRQLTSLGNFTFNPAWSKDGTQIVFAHDFDIYVVNADGSQPPRQLTDHPGRDEQPDWSPDGKKIVWTSQRNGVGYELFMMNPDGSGIQQVTTSIESENNPSFMPAEGSVPIPPPVPSPQVVFVSAPIVGCCALDVYMQRLDGTDRVRLTNQPTPGEFRPRWSPDGRAILFNRNGNLYTIDADMPGSEQLFLANADQGSYSPLGDKVVFTRGFRLYELALPSRTERQLSTSAMDEGVPTYAPDNETIVFMGMNGSGQNVYRRDKDGTEVQLTFDGISTYPSYSPLGDLVLFQSGKNIYTMTPSGQQVTLLTRDASVSGASLYPTWSPDGSSIVFSVQRSGQNEIYVMNADGSNPRPVTTTADDTETYPSVRPGVH